MDKRKIVQAAREKVSGHEETSSGRENVGGGQKSLLVDVIGAFINMVGDASNNDSNETQSSARENGGKTSGRKPQGRVASIGSRVADQLKGNKD